MVPVFILYDALCLVMARFGYGSFENVL